MLSLSIVPSLAIFRSIPKPFYDLHYEQRFRYFPRFRRPKAILFFDIEVRVGVLSDSEVKTIIGELYDVVFSFLHYRTVFGFWLFVKFSKPLVKQTSWFNSLSYYATIFIGPFLYVSYCLIPMHRHDTICSYNLVIKCYIMMISNNIFNLKIFQQITWNTEIYIIEI